MTGTKQCPAREKNGPTWKFDHLPMNGPKQSRDDEGNKTRP